MPSAARSSRSSSRAPSGATEPHAGASEGLKAAQRQLKIAQWAIPAITGVLIVMGAQQGEQQKPSQQLRTRLAKG